MKLSPVTLSATKRGEVGSEGSRRLGGSTSNDTTLRQWTFPTRSSGFVVTYQNVPPGRRTPACVEPSPRNAKRNAGCDGASRKTGEVTGWQGKRRGVRGCVAGDAR